jgi:hypothetical protein
MVAGSSTPTIDIPAVAHRNDQHQELVVVDLVQDPVIADADAPDALWTLTSQELRARGPGRGSEAVDRPGDPDLRGALQAPELPFGARS